MPRTSRLAPRIPALLVGGVFAVGLFPGNAVAQQGRDFLFGAPDVTLGVHAGWASPRAGGDIFDFTREQLTVGKGDFASASWGLHLGVRATERLEVAVDMTFADAEARSELRNWEEEDGRPIEQTTRLRRRPLSVSLKGYLMDRGRSISRFAWIPAPVAPYVGAGAGIMWHSFEQSGDFVDDLDPEDAFIYSDIYRSSGTSPTAHVLAGLDVSVGPRFVLTAEGRYLWASDEMGRDFVDFDDIDLAGFQATAGISVRF